jgi:RimJ/RimL family protein N-acetyltransferase
MNDLDMSNQSNYLKKISYKYKELGARIFFKSFIRLVWRKEKYLVFRKRKKTDKDISTLYENKTEIIKKFKINKQKGLIKNVNYKIGTKDDITLIISQFPSHYNKENILAKLSCGDQMILGLTGYENREICCISWVSEFDSLLEDISKIISVKHAACIKKVFVPPQFRREGIAEAIHQLLEEIAFKLGYYEIYAFVLENNEAPKKIYLRRNYKLIGKLQKKSFLGHKTIHFL